LEEVRFATRRPAVNDVGEQNFSFAFYKPTLKGSTMDIVYLLIPVSLVLVGLMVWTFLWATKSGQFDDLEGPAHEILMDDDNLPVSTEETQTKK
jgi:cbb3-type cytochrome oxidase maturation protein